MNDVPEELRVGDICRIAEHVELDFVEDREIELEIRTLKEGAACLRMLVPFARVYITATVDQLVFVRRSSAEQ